MLIAPSVPKGSPITRASPAQTPLLAAAREYIRMTMGALGLLTKELRWGKGKGGENIEIQTLQRPVGSVVNGHCPGCARNLCVWVQALPLTGCKTSGK